MIINDFIKKPKISIIITYHNLGKYIKDCVLSILEQTYENYEIIIVNDFSDIENSKILDEIQNDKIKKISLNENKGQLIAFLEGLKISSGEFICMIDADDILLPNHLKALLCAHLNTNHALISCACGEINEFGEVTSLNYINNPIKKKNNISKNEIEDIFNTKETFNIKPVKEAFGLWGWNPSSSAMFRKEALEILKFYPNKEFWKTGADKVIFSLLHLIGGSANIDYIGFLYRHHDNNASSTGVSTGNKRHLSESYIKKLISWNKQLRLDSYKMLIKNKKEIIEKYNKFYYLKILFKIIFSINIKLCAKAFKTFAHKLINF
ncbi:MAG: glycosyltransferase [Candidatus Gastranaerophilales bacterium]|nr:glycosyltransferase [Candidatus Gastranaerophilales bacterium]